MTEVNSTNSQTQSQNQANLLDENNISTSILDNTRQSLDSQMNDLSLQEMQNVEHVQPAISKVKTQVVQKLSRHERLKKREATDLIPPRQRGPKKKKEYPYPDSCRALIYSYLDNKFQFTMIRQLADSELQILSYVQTLRVLPEIRINIVKIMMPSNFKASCLWEFSRNILFVFDNFVTTVDQFSVSQTEFLQKEQIKEQTFQHNLGHIANTLKGNNLERQIVNFEIGCYNKFSFPNDSWLTLGDENNIEFRVKKLTLSFSGQCYFRFLNYNKYSKLFSESLEIERKRWDVLGCYFMRYINENLNNRTVEEMQFKCKFLKISSIIHINSDLFMLLGNLTELLIYCDSVYLNQDFQKFNSFPQNLQKLSYLVANTKKFVTNNSIIPHPTSVLSPILSSQHLFVQLQQLEIYLCDFSVVVEHANKFKKLNLLVLRNLDKDMNNRYKVFENLSNYLDDFVKLMKGKHMAIKIFDEHKKYINPGRNGVKFEDFENFEKETAYLVKQQRPFLPQQQLSCINQS
eukprot:403335369